MHRIIFPTAVVLLGLLLLAAPGCSPPEKPGSKKSAEGKGPDKTVPSPIPKVELKEITASDRTDTLEFAGAYAAAMSAGDDTSAQAAWNLDALLSAALDGADEAAPDGAADLLKEFRESAANHPGGVLWAYFKQPWRVLHFHKDEASEEFRVLCRVFSDGGISYLDLIPRRTPDDAIVWADVHVYSAGEKQSEIFRTLFLPKLARVSQIPIADLSDDPDLPAGNLDDLVEMGRSIKAGRHQQVIDAFNQLPEDLQQRKPVMLACLTAAAKLLNRNPGNQVAADQYEKVFQPFEQKLGNEPSYLLMGIDYCIFREDYNAAWKMIADLDKRVEGDPLLDFFRASLLMAEGKFQEALPYAEAAAKSEPELEEPVWGTVNIQLALENFGAVATGLDRLATDFDYVFDLKSDPAFEKFRESLEGETWIEKHRVQTAEAGNE